MIIAGTIIVFAAAAARLYSKRNILSLASAYIISVYLISFLCAGLMMLVEGRELATVPTAFFLIVLFLSIFPLISVKLFNEKNCPIPQWDPALTPYAWILAALGCFASISNLPSAIDVVFSGQLAQVRESVYEIGGDLSIISTLASGVWPMCLILFLYAQICRRPLLLIICLGVGSISGAVLLLAVAGRSGVVYLSFSFLYVIILFRPLFLVYKKTLYRKLIILSLYTLIGMMVFSFFLAFERGIGSNGSFSVVSDNIIVNTIYSLVIYAGSSILNFQDFWYIYDDFDSNLMGRRTFPVICGALRRLNILDDFSAVDILTVYKPFYDAHNLEHAVFCGFQRELMADFGRFGTLLVSSIWAAVGWIFRKRYEEKIDLLSVTAMTLFGLMPLLGVFFLSYGEINGNVSLLIIIATLVYLKVIQKTNAESRMNSQENPS